MQLKCILQELWCKMSFYSRKCEKSPFFWRAQLEKIFSLVLSKTFTLGLFRNFLDHVIRDPRYHPSTPSHYCSPIPSYYLFKTDMTELAETQKSDQERQLKCLIQQLLNHFLNDQNIVLSSIIKKYDKVRKNTYFRPFTKISIIKIWSFY